MNREPGTAQHSALGGEDDAGLLAAKLRVVAANQRTISVVGGCMWPLLRTGVSVELRPLTGLPRRGAILVIARGDGIVIHRLLKLCVEPDRVFFVTKGDLATFADAPIERPSVLGEAVRVHYQRFSLSLDGPVMRWIGVLVSACGSATSLVPRSARRGTRVILRAVRRIWRGRDVRESESLGCARLEQPTQLGR